MPNKYAEIISQGDYESLTDLLEEPGWYFDTPEEAIKLLCRLQSVVANVVHEYSHSADCICGETPRVGAYRNSGVAVRFIVEATLEKIKNEMVSRVE